MMNKKRWWKKTRRFSKPRVTGKALRFTPSAWAKLEFFRDRENCEIGGFGITSHEDNSLVVEFVTVRQRASAVSICFDDEAVADFFDSQIELGRRPAQVARIWCHTHPGSSPMPSSVDEETFSRVFGGCDWAAMFVLARGGARYARLRFNVGPGGELLVPVWVDFRVAFGASDHEGWEQEYQANIRMEQTPAFKSTVQTSGEFDPGWFDFYPEYAWTGARGKGTRDASASLGIPIQKEDDHERG